MERFDFRKKSIYTNYRENQSISLNDTYSRHKAGSIILYTQKTGMMGEIQEWLYQAAMLF